MKLIVAGSRTFNISSGHLDSIIKFLKLSPTEIVSGGAQGVDAAGEEYAQLACNYPIKLKTFKADWDTYGKAAGPIRNKEMAQYADAAIVIWDGESRGSADMIKNMKKLNKPVYQIIFKRD